MKENTHKEYIEKYPFESVEGKSGTLIIFDTDTFHKGGVVEKNKERLIIRLHNK